MRFLTAILLLLLMPNLGFGQASADVSAAIQRSCNKGHKGE